MVSLPFSDCGFEARCLDERWFGRGSARPKTTSPGRKSRRITVWLATDRMPTECPFAANLVRTPARRPVSGRPAGGTTGPPGKQATCRRTNGDTWSTQPAASWQSTPSAARRSFPPTASPGRPPTSLITSRAPGDTDMRIVFWRHPCPADTRPSRGVPGLRPRTRGPPRPDRPPQLRRRRTRPQPLQPPRTLSPSVECLVDELREAHEQPLHLPEPRDDRLRAIARRLHGTPGDNATLAELGSRTEPAPAPSADCSATNSA